MVSLNAVVFVIVLLWSSACFAAGGRALTKERFRQGKLRTRGIGSRPPVCSEMCASCGQCEAVEVPISMRKRRRESSVRLAYARGDDVTNYLPVSWKCKCGEFFFNP